jgi:hypothetical protein
LSATNDAARQAEQVVREVTEEYAKEHAEKDGKPREVLKSLTTFVGGWRATLLVLGFARAAAAQLRAGHYRSQ